MLTPSAAMSRLAALEHRLAPLSMVERLERYRLRRYLQECRHRPALA